MRANQGILGWQLRKNGVKTWQGEERGSPKQRGVMQGGGSRLAEDVWNGGRPGGWMGEGLQGSLFHMAITAGD